MSASRRFQPCCVTGTGALASMNAETNSLRTASGSFSLRKASLYRAGFDHGNYLSCTVWQIAGHEATGRGGGPGTWLPQKVQCWGGCRHLHADLLHGMAELPAFILELIQRAMWHAVHRSRFKFAGLGVVIPSQRHQAPGTSLGKRMLVQPNGQSYSSRRKASCGG